MSFIVYMIRFSAGLFVSLSILFAVNEAIGQSNYGHDDKSITHRHFPIYSGGVGYGHYHASTASEGYLRGRAAVIEAIGNFQVLDGQARILREQARSLDRENDLQQTAALQTQKKMWEDARIQARKNGEQRRAEGRQVLAERRATVYRQAYELPASELNLITGAISWPIGLQGEAFAENRTRVEELFRQHVGYGAPRANVAVEIARSVEQCSRILRSEAGSMSREDYLAAQKFLMGLKYGAASAVEST